MNGSDFVIGGVSVAPGERKSFFMPSRGLGMPDGSGSFWSLPVVVVRGLREGPVFEVDGCIHGEEQEGALTVLELARRLNPDEMAGTFVGVPVLNGPGFLSYGGVRGNPADLMYVDMNRQFPGDAGSMSATRRAVHTFWTEIIAKCDYTVNLHGCAREQIPRVVYSEDQPETFEMAKAVACTEEWIIASGSEHTRLREDTINRACTEAGIPNIFIESGSGDRGSDAIRASSNRVVEGVLNCMRRFGVLGGEVVKPSRWRRTEYYTHVRGRGAGILRPEPCLKAGTPVREGDLLCTVLDFLGGEMDRVHAPHDGVILMEPSSISVGPEAGICLLAYPPRYFT